MIDHQPSHETFAKEVAEHQMTIIRDDGLNRHLRFKAPDTIMQYFDIITWKGHLCYTGDMGTFVFARIDDMFNFFTARDTVRINPGYWAEKLLAVDKMDGYSEFDQEAFIQTVRDELAEYILDRGVSRADRRELIDSVDDEILRQDLSNEYEAYNRVYEFHDKQHPDLFIDFWEHNFRRPTTRYIWCCRALVWAIEHYNQAVEAAA